MFADLVHFRPVPYIAVFIWFEEKLTDLRFWARIHRSTDLCCDFYDLSNIHTGWSGRPSIITTNIIYSHRAEHMTDDEVVCAVVEELAEFLPAAARVGRRHAVVNRIPMAIHCPYPGTEARRPSIETPISGLFLAGDWLDTGFPSSMEGAVRAGWLAAESMLARAGTPRELARTHRGDDGLVPLLARLPRGLRARRAMRLLR